MRKTLMRLTSLLIAVLMVSALFIGCSQKGEDQQQKKDNVTNQAEANGKKEENNEDVQKKEIPTYKITMTMYGAQTSVNKPKYYDDVLNKINEKLSSEEGFKIDPEVIILPNEQYEEKINVDLAAGKSYDLVRHNIDIRSLVNKNLVKDITGLLEKNGQSIKENIPNNVWGEVSSNGKIFAIPMPAFPIWINGWIRGDWLDKIGMQPPSTVSELESIMQAFRDEDLDENGINDTVPLLTLYDHVEMFLLGLYTDTPGDFVDNNGNVRPRYYAKGYKDFVELLRKWYKEGYIDDFIFNGEEGQLGEIFGQNKAGIQIGKVWELEWGSTSTINKSRPETKIRFFPQFGKELKKYMSPGIATEYVFVPTTSKNPEAAIKYLDWFMYDEENYRLVMSGIEGLTYQIDGSTIKPPQSELDAGVESIEELKGHFANVYNARFNFEFWPSSTPKESINAYKYCANIDLSKAYVPVSKYIGVSVSDNAKIKSEDAESIADDYISRIVRGEMDISAFDEMLKEYEKAGGLDKYEELKKAYK